jgi:NAD(P)-dependent dehydrogenase (short-subunit alcohol dehydrogenase family)
MDVRLDGKVSLVTGGSRGIGRAIAEAMAASGASIMVSSRKVEDLERTAADIRSVTDADVAVFAANAGDPDQAEACVAATVERFGTLDLLVNNAATNPYFGPTMDIYPARFDNTVQVNWRGPLTWTQAAWRAAMADRGGVVLNVASVGGMATEPSIGIYNGTKAAVLHLTRQLALELAPGVRVVGLAPGLVKTDMARALWEPNEATMARHTPLGRLGEPIDIANAAVFLCSDHASWITGTTLVIDGGALLRA